MNLTINPGAATEDAQQIDRIVAEIEKSMEVLNAAIERNIPDGIETAWSDQVKTNWKTYYSNDVPEAMAEMKQSATNLRLAVESALKYSEER